MKQGAASMLIYHILLKTQDINTSTLYMQLLSHGAECNMANSFRVSHILQLISRALGE